MADIAYTSQLCREHLPERLALIAADREQLAHALEQQLADGAAATADSATSHRGNADEDAGPLTAVLAGARGDSFLAAASSRTTSWNNWPSSGCAVYGYHGTASTPGRAAWHRSRRPRSNRAATGSAAHPGCPRRPPRPRLRRPPRLATSPRPPTPNAPWPAPGRR
ncbi:CurL C-terminal domain-containing protein [Streptomyces avermitilis]